MFHTDGKTYGYRNRRKLESFVGYLNTGFKYADKAPTPAFDLNATFASDNKSRGGSGQAKGWIQVWAVANPKVFLGICVGSVLLFGYLVLKCLITLQGLQIHLMHH